MFDLAAEALAQATKILEQQGNSREAVMLEADYSKAEEAWTKSDYVSAKTYLQKVLDKAAEIPERALLYLSAILAIVLLPALLCSGKPKNVMNRDPCLGGIDQPRP